HKGGQQNGIFLQITGEAERDIAIPEKDFSFHTLIMAQALGDAQALASRGFTVMRLHITNRADGVAEILAASRSIV
ncbi:MAG: glucose-6-phosphate isomerase, partial [Streptomycetaceae bacterium]